MLKFFWYFIFCEYPLIWNPMALHSFDLHILRIGIWESSRLTPHCSKLQILIWKFLFIYLPWKTKSECVPQDSIHVKENRKQFDLEDKGILCPGLLASFVNFLSRFLYVRWYNDNRIYSKLIMRAYKIITNVC